MHGTAMFARMPASGLTAEQLRVEECFISLMKSAR